VIGEQKFLYGAVIVLGFENLIGLYGPITYILIYTPAHNPCLPSALPFLYYYSFSQRQNEKDKWIEKTGAGEES
jgi:hypothetical protein